MALLHKFYHNNYAPTHMYCIYIIFNGYIGLPSCIADVSILAQNRTNISTNANLNNSANKFD